MSKLFNNTISLNEILEAIQNKAVSSGPMVTLPAGTSSISMSPNVYYILPQPVSTTLSMTLISGPEGELSEYMLEIRADEDDIKINFTDPIQWNQAKNVYDISTNSISLEGRYTHYLSIINNKGLTGATVNPKLPDTSVTYNTSTAKLC